MRNRSPRVATAVSVLGVLLLVSVLPSVLLAAPGELPPGVVRLLDEAPVVVAGVAERSETLWKENSHGDKVVITRTLVRTREVLKGDADTVVWVDAEGGTLDGVTLRVSSAPSLKPGEPAVLFLDRQNDGSYSLHEQGRGLLKLDARDVVRGTSLTLAEIRQAALARSSAR